MFLFLQVFDTISLSDPKQRKRVRPDYSKELLVWRAKLRPFLFPDGVLAAERPLESMSEGVVMLQTATELTSVGTARRDKMCCLYAEGKQPSSRPWIAPHCLTQEEDSKYNADERRTVFSLKTEFDNLLKKLPNRSICDSLCKRMDSAKLHAEVLACVMELRVIAADAEREDVDVDHGSD